jgi:hypothetical protein
MHLNNGRKAWVLLVGVGCLLGLLIMPSIAYAQDDDLVECGDAPTSWNYWGIPMTAYPWLGPGSANFPVAVYPWAPASPDGYGICNLPYWLDNPPSHLGLGKSLELDADQLPDEDDVTNIDPVNDTADRDGLDDGVAFPGVMPHCGTAVMNVNGFAAEEYYVTAWFDWNRDGDWNDESVCGCGDHEWGVRDVPVGPGTFSVPIGFVPCHPASSTDPLWVRVTLSPQSSAVMGPEWEAGGIGWWEACPTDGETEDYYVQPEAEFVPEWGSIALLGSGLAGLAGYATLRWRKR